MVGGDKSDGGVGFGSQAAIVVAEEMVI